MILSQTRVIYYLFYNVFFFHSCWTHCFWGANYHPMCCNEKVLAKKMLATPHWGLRHPFPTWRFQQMQPLQWNLCFINSKYYWEYEGNFFKNIFFLHWELIQFTFRRASLWTDALHFFLWGSSSCGNEWFLSSSLFVICWADLFHKKWIE